VGVGFLLHHPRPDSPLYFPTPPEEVIDVTRTYAKSRKDEVEVTEKLVAELERLLAPEAEAAVEAPAKPRRRKSSARKAA
jgi:hypothetical protein